MVICVVPGERMRDKRKIVTKIITEWKTLT